MNRIRVSFTNQGRILTIPCPSSLPSLLRSNEEITHSWFYDKPDGLESFFKKNPDQEDLFPKGFAYWILCKAFKIQEDQNNYGLLKRKLQQFSSRLFRAIRSLAGRIADQIYVFKENLPKKHRMRQSKCSCV